MGTNHLIIDEKSYLVFSDVFKNDSKKTSKLIDDNLLK